MTVYELIENYQQTHRNGHFFDRDTLRFFGERISEMRVLTGTATIKDYSDVLHECYILSYIQHKAPGGKKRVYHYFDTKTFDNIIPNRLL